MTTQDLYTEITNKIVDSLEAGGLPAWRKPWTGGDGGFLPLRHNGIAYRGINAIILWAEASINGFASSHWFTFKQARDLGGCVRKGEKSTAILFCQPQTKETTAPDGTESKDSFWISKTYRVFNANQCEGLPDRFNARPVHNLDPAQRIEHAETFIKNTGADIRHAPGGAFYRPSDDIISLPPFESFTSPEAYAATALHELGHWTGHGSRLGRELKTERQAYSREEIIAELSSVFTCSSLGIAPPDLGEHAAYIGHWIAALKEDPRYLFSAASKAQAATDYLNNLQPTN